MQERQAAHPANISQGGAPHGLAVGDVDRGLGVGVAPAPPTKAQYDGQRPQQGKHPQRGACKRKPSGQAT